MTPMSDIKTCGISSSAGSRIYTPGAAVALSPDLTAEEEQVEKLTNEILHKEVDLERFYLQYRKIGTASPKFRRIRYYLLQVASTSVTLASNIIFTDVAARGLKDNSITVFGRGDGDVDTDTPSGPGASGAGNSGGGGGGSGSSGNSSQRNSTTPSPAVKAQDTTPKVRAGIILATIGVILGPGSSLLELCSNGFTTVKNIKNGDNPASAVRRVEARIKEIDDLMEQRSKIIAEHPELKALAINKAEHTVLLCFRDWCLSEFIKIYAEAKSSQAGANAYYAMDVANGGCSLAGNLLALESLSPSRDRLAGPAATVSVVGDCISVASAPLSAYAGKHMYKFWHNRLRKKMATHLHYGEDEAKQAMLQLNSIIAKTDSDTIRKAASVEARVAAYVLWAQRYDKINAKQELELSHRSKVAHQGQRMGPLISGTGLAQDLLATVAFYGQGNNERRGASLSLAGAVTAGSGNVAGLAYTNANFIGEYIFRKKLRRQNLLPEQLMAERALTLNQIDQIIEVKNKK